MYNIFYRTDNLTFYNERYVACLSGFIYLKIIKLRNKMNQLCGHYPKSFNILGGLVRPKNEEIKGAVSASVNWRRV